MIVKMDKALLLRYIEGNCTDQDKEFIAEWLDASPEHMKEYLALRKLYDISVWQTPPVTSYAQKPGRKISGLSLKAIYTEAMKIAAILAVTLLVLYYFFRPQTTERAVVMQVLQVPAGQRAQITLEDGTKVWLNAKTTLTFPNQFTGATRQVQLDGEGYFEVVSDKAKPFIVSTLKYNVKAWGTTFNVKAYAEKEIFETSLFEGSVEMLKSDSAGSTWLRPGEQAIMQNNHLTVKNIEHKDYFLWKEGIISFDDESFPEMVKKLELCFDLKVNIKNDKIKNYHCTGKFRSKDGVEHILKVLQLNNKFRYTINDKLNTIIIE
jgi:transmembrane sensor